MLIIIILHLRLENLKCTLDVKLPSPKTLHVIRIVADERYTKHSDYKLLVSGSVMDAGWFNLFKLIN